MVVNDRTFQRNGVLNDEVVQEVEVVAARQYVVKRGSGREFRRTGSHGEEATAAWQMRCEEARGLRGVELAGAKAEVEKPKLPKAVAGAAAVRGGTWRGPPEMTTLRRGIVAPRYNTYVLVSLIGLLLQTQSATGECLLVYRMYLSRSCYFIFSIEANTFSSDFWTGIDSRFDIEANIKLRM